ncbi:MAG: hypothetical protein KF709_05890 [Gemmatimonadaceae bacterium]|nr:hypothetical protein [Gemmatimonadaceae bacterium]
MAHGIPARLTAAEGRKFGLTVGIAFAVLAGITFWREHPTMMKVFGSLAALFIAGGLFVPTMMGPVERAWMKLALLISKVTTPIFMGVVFFVVITPISLLMRLFGKLPLRTDPNATTYWHLRPEGERRSDLSRQF